jgi:hypothetical protein
MAYQSFLDVWSAFHRHDTPPSFPSAVTKIPAWLNLDAEARKDFLRISAMAAIRT